MDMKWPSDLTFIRHDVSAYNVLKAKKEADPIYRLFVEMFRTNPDGETTKRVARQLWLKYKLDCSDAETPLIDSEAKQTQKTGQGIKKFLRLPDIILVSPYRRAKDTLKGLTKGWPELAEVKTLEEERIREQEHGLAALYNDWRIFQVFHPEQRLLYEQDGSYRYRYPQGENVPDVRVRSALMIETFIREYSGKTVMCICHHLNILAMRANLERLNEEQFLSLDAKDKPINCGVTVYRGDPKQGKNGRLVLDFYNKKFY
jgi:broad specificity phosphatase PhoE